MKDRAQWNLEYVPTSMIVLESPHLRTRSWDAGKLAAKFRVPLEISA